MAINVNPQKIFADDYAIVLLNREIKLDANFFVKIWNNAKVRHVVDGGANNFFAFLNSLPENTKNDVKFPELASGDFDSITEESMSLLKSHEKSNCKIVETPDQDDTDFTKALAVLHNHIHSTENVHVKNVISICEFGGRLDQIISNLNTLYKNVFLQSDPQASETSVFLMTSETLSWLLPANSCNRISFESQVPNLVCGIIPFSGPTSYTSTGLKWDLTPDMICQFGSLVSTSNMVIGQVVEMTSKEKHSLFTLELKSEQYLF